MLIELVFTMEQKEALWGSESWNQTSTYKYWWVIIYIFFIERSLI